MKLSTDEQKAFEQKIFSSLGDETLAKIGQKLLEEDLPLFSTEEIQRLKNEIVWRFCNQILISLEEKEKW